MCFYGWVLESPIVHVPSPCICIDGGLEPPIVIVPALCISMDGGLEPPIVHVPSPCVSLDGVEDLLLFMCPLHVFL